MSAIASTAMRETECEDILGRLDRIVRWSNHFSLAFIRCDTPSQQSFRRRLIDRLAGLSLLEIVLDQPLPTPSLLDKIAGEWDKNHPPAAVCVYGLEHSIDAGEASKVLGRLNHERNLWREQIPVAVLICLPDEALSQMTIGAPDFWAWRSSLLEWPTEAAPAITSRPSEILVDVKTLPGAPKVFISSTVIDLPAHRVQAQTAALRAGFLPVMSEDWPAQDTPPLQKCLAKVDGTHLTVALVAYRYGWVPAEESGGKSITWLECERTQEQGKDLLVFVVDEQANWPEDKREEFRLALAAKEGRYQELAQLGQEVERHTRQLKAFKAWLTANRIRNTFDGPEDLGRKVESALREWLDQHPEFKPQAKAQARAQVSPERYLGHVYESCGHIDIRGLQVGSGKAHRFPIEDLYIELETRGGGQLKNTLGNPRRIVIGDPGAGKTTFLRWIAHILAGDCLGISDNAAQTKLGIFPPISKDDKEAKRGIRHPLLPALVSIADWLEHIQAAQAQPGRPTTPKDPQWLVDYLAQQAESRDFGLDKAWFQQQLQQGRFMLLFDGLDEAPDETRRARAAALIEAVASTWKGCPILATSRPAGYEDRAVLPGFASSQIESLGDQSVQTFLERWSAALFLVIPKQHLPTGKSLAKP